MAVASGEKILGILDGDKSAPLSFYCSPYLRTKQTLHGLLKALGENPVEGVREEPQLTGVTIAQHISHVNFTRF